jgi:hypothetical protein
VLFDFRLPRAARQQEDLMAQSTPLEERAVQGIAAIEQRIIEEAERNNIRGLRLEWNEDLDFGHLMDPVPVVAITSDGRQVEEHFALADMADFGARARAQCEAKIEHIVRALADAEPSEDSSGSRGM